MEQVKGTNIGCFPLRDLRKVADLIYFDGALLSLFKNESGYNYLYYWCDSTEDVNRWLVFRVSQRDLDDYLSQKNTLHDLIIKPSDGILFSVDIDHEQRYRNIY